ncbi:VOC family protein [Cellulomonas phragmiteti]|nr:VOC family protein [Cellulomonas phragmiteti]
MILVSLPVRDVAASRAFYDGLGFPVNEMLSDELSACVVVSGTICVMLLRRDRFATCTQLPVVDARTGTQVLLCLTASSRAEVDALTAHAIAGGGSEPRAPVQSGPTYARTVADPDGHVWEILHTHTVPAA